MGTQSPPELFTSSEQLKAQVLFLTRVQHELRTPISTVIGFCKDLLSKGSDAERTDKLQQILLVGQEMMATVDSYINEQTLSRSRSHPCPPTASLRHDLRNAIHVLHGYVDVLVEEAGTGPETDYLEDLSRIRHAGDDVIRAIDALSMPSGPAEAHVAQEAVSSLSALSVADGHEAPTGTVLLVEDNRDVRELLRRQVTRQGHRVACASNGREALQMLGQAPVDVVILDLLMPGMNGYEVLAALKANEALAHIPVIVISAFDDPDSIERCIQLGAAEYLTKSYNPALLRARLSACLERKLFRDRERQYLEEIQEERRRSDRLLQSILPISIAERLKGGETRIAESFDAATVLFADLVDFTKFAADTPAERLLTCLNEIFTSFDELVEAEGVEKIKTVGDAYMVAGGLPEPRADHAEAVVRLGLAMLKSIARMNRGRRHRFQLRIGMHSGPVVAGVIGRSRLSYDLWGDTVNVASRMQTYGVPGWIQVSKATHDLVCDRFAFEERGAVRMHGKGAMTTYLLKDD